MYIGMICGRITYMKILNRKPVSHSEVQRNFSKIASEVRNDEIIVPIANHGKVYGYFVPASLMDNIITATLPAKIETDPEKLLLLSDQENEKLAPHWIEVASRIQSDEDFEFVDEIEREWPLDS